MSFSSRFPDQTLMNILGDDIVYIKGGLPHPIKAIVEFDVERVGGDGYTIERTTEIEFLQSALPGKPERGERIAFEDQAFTVDGVVSDNGDYYRVTVK